MAFELVVLPPFGCVRRWLIYARVLDANKVIAVEFKWTILYDILKWDFHGGFFEVRMDGQLHLSAHELLQREGLALNFLNCILLKNNSFQNIHFVSSLERVHFETWKMRQSDEKPPRLHSHLGTTQTLWRNSKRTHRLPVIKTTYSVKRHQISQHSRPKGSIKISLLRQWFPHKRWSIDKQSANLFWISDRTTMKIRQSNSTRSENPSPNIVHPTKGTCKRCQIFPIPNKPTKASETKRMGFARMWFNIDAILVNWNSATFRNSRSTVVCNFQQKQ